MYNKQTEQTIQAFDIVEIQLMSGIVFFALCKN